VAFQFRIQLKWTDTTKRDTLFLAPNKYLKGIQLILISVIDKGIGISDEEKHKIFEKFYRVGNEETRNTKGTGLGLFIVKHVVNFHHGEIKVSDNAPTGTVFRVTLPLK